MLDFIGDRIEVTLIGPGHRIVEYEPTHARIFVPVSPKQTPGVRRYIEKHEACVEVGSY